MGKGSSHWQNGLIWAGVDTEWSSMKLADLEFREAQIPPPATSSQWMSSGDPSLSPPGAKSRGIDEECRQPLSGQWKFIE